jgi:hypothetical protein
VIDFMELMGIKSAFLRCTSKEADPNLDIMMKTKLAILLLSGWMIVGFGVEAEARTYSTDHSVKTELGLFGKKKKKKKRYKGYKKPRNKKFLGIFKRKSSCDCPKH